MNKVFMDNNGIFYAAEVAKDYSHSEKPSFDSDALALLEELGPMTSVEIREKMILLKQHTGKIPSSTGWLSVITSIALVIMLFAHVSSAANVTPTPETLNTAISTSMSITTASTAQIALPTNTSRTDCLIVNTSATTEYVDIAASAPLSLSASLSGIPLAANGGSFNCQNGNTVIIDYISIFSASAVAAATYRVYEWIQKGF